MMLAYVHSSEEKGYEGVVTVSIACLFMVSFFMTQSFITDCYISQAVSMEDVRIVDNEIEKYEEETGLRIRTIASRRTAPDARRYYDGSVAVREFSYAMPIVFAEWSQGAYVNYVNEKDYEYREMTMWEYNKYFGGLEWDTFDPETQLVFEGDTLYWAVY